MPKAKSAQALVLLCCGWSSLSFAADFYTIIGPDGRPMIIQQNAKQSQSQAAKAKTPKAAPKLETQPSKPVAVNSADQTKNKNLAENQAQPAHNTKASVQRNHQNLKDQSRLEQAQQQKPSSATSTANQPKADKSATSVAAETTVHSAKTEQKHQQAQFTQTPHVVVQPKPISKDAEYSDRPVQPVESSQHTATPATSAASAQAKMAPAQQQPKSNDSKFTEIDGVQYVDNEYLEDKEFNLEGKKRFYIMSESGVAGGRQFETVEREKGITKSVFSKFLKSDKRVDEPIVLASTYFRLPKQQVIENLQQACFSGKKIEKAKVLTADKDEIGFWPVAPIKEDFAYEVVKLDQPVENIQLSSYASSQKNPSYYWPLVVFLDQQGCVLEGVTGFKREYVEANHRQFASLTGILKKPNQAHFLLMTPLAESVDIEHLKLSHTGQIKLYVLR